MSQYYRTIIIMQVSQAIRLNQVVDIYALATTLHRQFALIDFQEIAQQIATEVASSGGSVFWDEKHTHARSDSGDNTPLPF